MIPADTPLQRYPFLLIAEGEFHLRLGHLGEAALCFRRAAELARTEPEQRFIQRKLTAV
jgi:predicted RNA polymerase sigma factor